MLIECSDDDLKLHYLRFGNDELGEQLLAYAETGKEPRIAGGLRNKSATIPKCGLKTKHLWPTSVSS